MGETEQLQQILNELLGVLSQLTQSGEVLSDELQGLVANELNFLVNRIQELSAPQQPSEVPEAPYPSSNIAGFKYDPKQQRLLIQFLGKFPNRQGPIYQYEGVPSYIFEVLRRGAVGPKTSGKNRWHQWFRNILPSHGATVWALIRAAGYPYQRVS